MTKWVIRGRQSAGSSVYAEAFWILLPPMRRCISVLSPEYLVFRGQDTRRITGWRLILTSFMKMLSLMFSGVLLTMNIATAAPEQLVSYHSTPVDGLEIFY